MPFEPDAREVLGGAERLKAALRPVMAGLAILFVGVAIWDLKRRWQPGVVEIHYGLAALSMLPLAGGCILLACGWIWLLSRMSGQRVPFLPALVLHLESQAARYTPGNVGVPLVRMLGAERLGTTSRIAGSSTLLEALSWLATGGVAGLLVLFVSGDLLNRVVDALGALGLSILCGFTLVLAVLLLVDRRSLPKRLLEALKVDGSGPLVPPQLPLMHAGYWLTWALHGYLVSRTVYASDAVALTSMGFYMLAPVMGFLALAAPGGLGVREAVVSIALASAIGPAAALCAALLSRGASVIVDFALWIALRPFQGVGARKRP